MTGPRDGSQPLDRDQQQPVTDQPPAPPPATRSAASWVPARPLAILASVAFAVAISFGLRAFGSLLSSFFLALVLVITVAPIRDIALRKGLPGWLATTLMFITGVGLLVCIGLGVAIALRQFVVYFTHSDFDANLNSLGASLESLLARFGYDGADIDNAVDSIDFSALAGKLTGVLTGLFGLASMLMTVVITMAFLSMDAARFNWFLTRDLSQARPHLAGALAGFVVNVRRYVKVNTIFGLGVAVVETILLLMLGVPLAFVWGLLSFLSSFIPNVGFLIGLFPPVILALAVKGPGSGLAVLAAYLVINTVSDNGLKPKFVGDAVGLSATLTFFSLLFWAWVFGAIGALLAVPLTLFVKAILVDADPNANWINHFISLNVPPEADDTPADDMLSDGAASA